MMSEMSREAFPFVESDDTCRRQESHGPTPQKKTREIPLWLCEDGGWPGGLLELETQRVRNGRNYILYYILYIVLYCLCIYVI
jgi:hypothetical protein